jgi:opacity protein-like surface antigen
MAVKSALLQAFVHMPAKGGYIHFLFLYLLLCFLLADPTFLQAAEWYIEPSLGGGVEYDDNGLLDIPKKSALTYSISPEFLFGVQTPPLHVRGAARVDVNRSTESELDETNVFSRLLSTYVTARNRWNINASLRKDTTRATDIVDPAALPGETLTSNNSDIIGLVRRIRVGRTLIGFEPTFSRVMTQRTNLDLGYRFGATFFGNTRGTRLVDNQTRETGLVDNQSHEIRGGVAYQYTPIDTITGRVAYTRFDSDNFQFDQVRLLTGIRHSFSETFTGDLLAGGIYTSSTSSNVSGGSTDDIGFTFLATLEKQLRTGKVITILQRDVSGGGFGFARKIEEIDIQWNTEIVPNRWFFFLAGRAFRTSNIGIGGDPRDNRTYYQIEPRLAWQLTRQLFLDISYRYRRNEQEVFGTADSNAIILGLVYNFDRWSISR